MLMLMHSKKEVYTTRFYSPDLNINDLVFCGVEWHCCFSQKNRLISPKIQNLWGLSSSHETIWVFVDMAINSASYSLADKTS